MPRHELVRRQPAEGADRAQHHQGRMASRVDDRLLTSRRLHGRGVDDVGRILRQEVRGFEARVPAFPSLSSEDHVGADLRRLVPPGQGREARQELRSLALCCHRLQFR